MVQIDRGSEHPHELSNVQRPSARVLQGVGPHESMLLRPAVRVPRALGLMVETFRTKKAPISDFVTSGGEQIRQNGASAKPGYRQAGNVAPPRK